MNEWIKKCMNEWNIDLPSEKESKIYKNEIVKST